MTRKVNQICQFIFKLSILALMAACSNGASDNSIKATSYPEAFGFYIQSNAGEYMPLLSSEVSQDRKNLGKPTVGQLGHTNAMQALNDPRFGKAHIVTNYIFKPDAIASFPSSPEINFFAINSQRPNIRWYGLSAQTNGDLLWKSTDSWKRQANIYKSIDANTVVVSSPAESVFKYSFPNPGNGCFVVEITDLGATNLHPVCFK